MAAVVKYPRTTKVKTAQTAVVQDLSKKFAVRRDVIRALEGLMQPAQSRVAVNSSWPAVLFVPLSIYAKEIGTTPNKILQTLVIDYLKLDEIVCEDQPVETPLGKPAKSPKK